MVWSTTDTNQKGQELFGYLATEDVEIRKTGETPTFRNALREEVLDLTPCSMSLADAIRLQEESVEVGGKCNASY